MSDYKTPGVYIEETSTLANSVASVSTAVPAFVGYTQRAGVNNGLFYEPTTVSTLKEYESLFGQAADETITVNVSGDSIVSFQFPQKVTDLYYSMQMFFNNGGESCYIVALDASDGLSEVKRFENGIDALELEDEPTLIVVPGAIHLLNNDFYSIYQRVLNQCNKMKDRFAIIDVIDSGSVSEDATTFRTGISANNLEYGAAYYPYLTTTLNYQYSDTSVIVAEGDSKVTLGKKGESNTALYNAIKSEIGNHYLTLPPSAAVAGVYASVDRDRGVWKAPANVSLSYVSGPNRKLTEEDNDLLNVDATSGKSINAIRNFTGKGTLVWGARTLAGNDNQWRYVSVRRLFTYIEESIQKSTAFAVFEPNNAMTWLKLRSMVESFLDTIWRQGALAGGKAEDAYFVQVGLGTTMTSQDILDGKLIIKVGIAAVRPAEFIILEFSHKVQTS